MRASVVDMFYAALRAALRPALGRGFEWVIDGDENIPPAGGVLLAANHISHFDALCLAYVADRRGRRVRFLAKASFFDVPVLASILRGVGDIPAGSRRGSPGSSLDAAVEALRAGCCLGIFPEGRISPDLEPLEARTGVARLAQGAPVPVVPVGLWGSHRVWTRGRWPRLRRRVAEAVAVGPPLMIGPDEDVHDAADRVMAAICAQVSKARLLYPERAAAGDAWWDLSPDTARVRTCRGLSDAGELWPASQHRRRRLRQTT